jgi:hypothetical protein
VHNMVQPFPRDEEPGGARYLVDEPVAGGQL